MYGFRFATFLSKTLACSLKIQAPFEMIHMMPTNHGTPQGVEVLQLFMLCAQTVVMHTIASALLLKDVNLAFSVNKPQNMATQLIVKGA